MISTICAECGKKIDMPLSQFLRSKEHFCSRQCHMKKMNRELNPGRMTIDTRFKLRCSRLGTGDKKGYTKTFGKASHREIMEQIIGRSLRPEEVVHHINGDKKDNNPENLMLFENQAAHARWHMLHRKEVMHDEVHST